MQRLDLLPAALVSLAIACGGAYHKSPGGVASSPDYAGESAYAGGDAEPAAARPAMAASGVKAGEWDDNANYRDFQKLLANSRGAGFHPVDIRDRQFIVVRDADGKAVPSCKLAVRGPEGSVVRLTTLSSGRAILFPRAEGITSPDIVIEASCGQTKLRKAAQISEGEGVIELDISTARAAQDRPAVDIAFVLDTTGSMSEEIEGVKMTIRAVADALDSLGADVRIGLVEYKDRTDPFVTRVYPLSDDINGFAARIDGLYAQGGGDTPESANAGLSVAMSQLSWNDRAVARLAFLVGDAPPHLDYGDDVSYVTSMRLAARRGIQVHTIAASGMDLMGQIVWRQIAQYTGGTNLFVLRGGAGPQSTGAGDPASSCGGTQQSYSSGNLDELVLGKVRAALAAVDGDPMRIAGLGQDERAKPCSERILATE